MISGNIKDIDKIKIYLSEDLQRGLEYLASKDFSTIANGKYEIDGEEMFAMVNTYETEAKELKKPEKHNEYIDIQYLGEGEETIYFAEEADCHIVCEDYADERDLLFYEDFKEKDCVNLRKGDFMILFPWELHRPGCKTNEQESNVQKVVIKVRQKNF